MKSVLREKASEQAVKYKHWSTLESNLSERWWTNYTR